MGVRLNILLVPLKLGLLIYKSSMTRWLIIFVFIVNISQRHMISSETGYNGLRNSVQAYPISVSSFISHFNINISKSQSL
jgi:hypothetical protein